MDNMEKELWDAFYGKESKQERCSVLTEADLNRHNKNILNESVMNKAQKSAETVVPFFDGFYNTVFEDYYSNKDEIGELFTNEINQKIQSVLPSFNYQFQSIYSPEYYNYGTDEIYALANYNQNDIITYLTNNLDDFELYCNRHFSNRDGFMSYLPNNAREFINEFKNVNSEDESSFILGAISFILEHTFGKNVGDDINSKVSDYVVENMYPDDEELDEGCGKKKKKALKESAEPVYISVDVVPHSGIVILKSDEFGKVRYLPDDFEKQKDTIKRAIEDYVSENNIAEYEIIKLYESKNDSEDELNEDFEIQPDLLDNDYDVTYKNGRRIYDFHTIHKALEKLLPDWEYTGDAYNDDELNLIYEPKNYKTSLNKEMLSDLRKAMAEKFGNDVFVRVGRSEYAPEQKKLFIGYLDSGDDYNTPEKELDESCGEKSEELDEILKPRHKRAGDNAEMRKEARIARNIRGRIRRIRDAIKAGVDVSWDDMAFLEGNQEVIKKYFPNDIELWQWANIPEDEWSAHEQSLKESDDLWSQIQNYKKKYGNPYEESRPTSNGVDDEIKKILNKYNQEYNFLYNNHDKVAGYEEAVRAWDEYINHPDFRELIGKVIKARHDMFTSDREIGALMFALDALGYLDKFDGKESSLKPVVKEFKINEGITTIDVNGKRYDIDTSMFVVDKHKGKWCVLDTKSNVRYYMDSKKEAEQKCRELNDPEEWKKWYLRKA